MAGRESVATALGAALRQFGQLSLDGGLLAQVWMPGEIQLNGRKAILSTKGLPYSILGPGDMLAIFRCLSCKYSFSADVNKQDAMGAPGRVFVSGEVETSDNVQGYKNSIYLRAKDAEACRVSSTLLLPIYASPERGEAAAVLEVTQFNSSGILYSTVFEWAKTAMEAVHLFTPAHIQTKTFEMQSHALSIRFFSSRNSALGCFFGVDSPAGVWQNVDLSGDMMKPATQAQDADSPRAKTDIDSTPRQTQQLSSDEGDDILNETPSPRDTVHNERQINTSSSSKALLTREDLERHFGYGLREAAQKLGVCNTTLKRACRRHGIMKWPRRELLKAARKQSQASGQSLHNKTLHSTASALRDHGVNLSSAFPMPLATSKSVTTPTGSFPPGFLSFLPDQRLDQPAELMAVGPSATTSASTPSHSLLDRSCSSSLDAHKFATPNALEGKPNAARDPLRLAIAHGLQQLNNPQTPAVHLTEGHQPIPVPTNDVSSAPSVLPDFSGSPVHQAPDLSNTERFESLGLGDAMNFLGSIGTELQDFNSFLKDENFDWSQDNAEAREPPH